MQSRRLTTTLFLLAAMFFVSSQASAQRSNTPSSLKDYALYLLQTEDYYRAISALKEYRYFYPSDTSIVFSSYYSAYSYLRSGKYQLGLDEAGAIPPELKERFPEAYLNTRVIQALCYNGMKLGTYALDELSSLNYVADTQGTLGICKALLYAETKRFDNADSLLQEVQKRPSITPTNRQIATQMRTLLSKVDSLPQKSPTLAGVLSAVVPGLGQMYAQHFFDGVQALAFVGTFAYATYATYHYESLTNKPRIGSSLFLAAAGAFYLSNILGAVRTAEYRNNRGIESLMLDIRAQALSVNLMIRFVGDSLYTPTIFTISSVHLPTILHHKKISLML